MAPDDSGLRVVVTGASAPGLAAWLRRAAPPRARGEVTVALVSDVRIRALNRTYRGKDYATDVLSFPAARSEVAQGFPPPLAVDPGELRRDTPRRQKREGGSRAVAALKGCATNYLGDIVIATGVARRQARDLGHTLAVELRILALHGLLHLLGYDHERDRGRMRILEQRLLRRSGLQNGLIARARPSTSSGRAVRGKHARGEPVEPRALPR